MMSESDLHDEKILFIKKHLNIVNEFGKQEWEIHSINSASDIVTFNYIGQRVEYVFDNDMLSIIYFPEVKYKLYD